MDWLEEVGIKRKDIKLNKESFFIRSIRKGIFICLVVIIRWEF